MSWHHCVGPNSLRNRSKERIRNSGELPGEIPVTKTGKVAGLSGRGNTLQNMLGFVRERKVEGQRLGLWGNFKEDWRS